MVAHPHPLYGGDLYNPVVEAVARAYGEAGYTTLRFNFRGVGGSQGEYAQGIGEQQDIQAALSLLEGLGKVSLDLVGYSFGAWVTALGAPAFDAAQRLILIAPPVSFFDFVPIATLPKLALVIAGSEDTIGGVEAIKAASGRWNPEARLTIIQGADHFFAGQTEPLYRVITAFLS